MEKEALVLNVGGKPWAIIAGKTHTISRLKTKSTNALAGIKLGS